MADDDPFGNIKAQLEGEDTKDDEQAIAPPDDEVDTPAKDTKDDEHTPAFPFSESEQGPIYPHESRWGDWEDAKFEIETHLRDVGVRDLQGREVDDALLRLGAESPERLGEMILEARGVDMDNCDKR